MSDDNISMEILEEIPNESHPEIENNEQEMEQPTTSKCLDEVEMGEPGPSQIITEETLTNKSETLINGSETLINGSETLMNSSETTNELLTETVPVIQTEEAPANKSKQNTRLPLARIKQIMKFDPDCSLISRDGLILVSKATEMFIEFLGKEAVKHTLNNKKKTISKRDVEAAIDCAPNLYFLDGALEWE